MTYFNDWADSKEEEMLRNFDITSEAIQGCEILFASYTYEDYSGSAFVIYRKDGKLYEVNAGHCSCHGLEGQWEPEETMVSAIRVRRHYGILISDEESRYFHDLLNKLEAESFNNLLNKQEGEGM